MKPTEYPEPAAWDYTVMEAGAQAIYAAWHAWINTTGPESTVHRWWLVRYYRKSNRPLHPVVDAMRKAWRPLDWQKLLLEWPYVAETDPTKIAYTQSQAHGEADRQTVTNIGKYLNRHWPHVADHIRRDAVAAYNCDEMEILKTREGIIYGIEYGPRSCMQSGYGSIPFNAFDKRKMDEWLKDKSLPEPRWEYHPYAVYSPEMGWGMATRKKEGVVLGRGLVLDNGDHKCFVRTYNRRSDEEYSSSSSDHVMEEWLKAQGYEKRDCWPDGAKLLHIDHPTQSGPMLPYIDGCDAYCRRVNRVGDHFEICYEDGSYTCDNTDGTVDEYEQDEDNTAWCEDCETHVDTDDMRYVGREDDHYICRDCRDNYYSLVRGSSRWDRYREYYVHNDNVADVLNNSYQIDPENVPDDVVMLHDGDYAELEDAVDIDGEYYLREDEDVCELASEWDGEMYYLKGNCWQCAGTENWYHEDDTDEKLEIDGSDYHQEFLTDVLATVPDRDTLNKVARLLRESRPAPVPVTVREPMPVPEPTPVPAWPSPAPATVTAPARPTLPANIAALCDAVAEHSVKAAEWIAENWSTHDAILGDHATTVNDLMRWRETPQGQEYWQAISGLTGGYCFGWTMESCRQKLAELEPADEVAGPSPVTVPETLPGMPQALRDLCRQVEPYSLKAVQWIEANWTNRPMFVSAGSMHSGIHLDCLMTWDETPQGHAYWYKLSGLVRLEGTADERREWLAEVAAVDNPETEPVPEPAATTASTATTATLTIEGMRAAVREMERLDSWVDEAARIDPAALQQVVDDMRVSYSSRLYQGEVGRVTDFTFIGMPILRQGEVIYPTDGL